MRNASYNSIMYCQGMRSNVHAASVMPPPSPSALPSGNAKDNMGSHPHFCGWGKAKAAAPPSCRCLLHGIAPRRCRGGPGGASWSGIAPAIPAAPAALTYWGVLCTPARRLARLGAFLSEARGSLCAAAHKERLNDPARASSAEGGKKAPSRAKRGAPHQEPRTSPQRRTSNSASSASLLVFRRVRRCNSYSQSIHGMY